jgi:hypothetical protein
MRNVNEIMTLDPAYCCFTWRISHGKANRY